jgi:exodeoxyribonuclease X
MTEFNNLIFIDTETTGLEEQDRIFQIAYEFQEKEYNELFKPPLPISCGSMEATHYTNKDVEEKPAFEGSEMQKHLAEIFEENIFVAHNAKFDIKMIEKENLKVGKFIDTLKVAQFLDPQGKLEAYRLQFLRYCLDLNVEDAQAHDALGDIRVLKALFVRLFEKMKKDLGDEKAVIEKMVEISSQPVIYKKINFGKYAGEKLDDVVKKDKGYLE